MAVTRILPNDPLKRRAWSARVAEDSTKEQYWARHKGAEGSSSIIVEKKDLESTVGAGDEVTTGLVAKLRGTPRIEGQKMAGAEFKLTTASHKMRVNVFRHGVNVGSAMDQSRIGINLKKQGRTKLAEYMAEMYEEIIAMAMAGARGVGDEITHYDTSWTGYPNDFRAPDAAHLFVGTDGTKAKNTLLAGDKLSLTTINRLVVKAKKMLGGQPGRAVKMTKTRIGGKECFALITGPEGIQDIREDVGSTGWIEAQRALVSAVGKDAELFKGGAGWFNGVMVDEAETFVRFGDYGSGSNIPAMRSLFCGANAGAVANGVKGMPDGMSVDLSEDTEDRGYEAVLNFMVIFGADKTRFGDMDYGCISVDHAFTPSV